MYLSVKVTPNLSPFFNLKKSMDQAYTLVNLLAKAPSTPCLFNASDKEPSNSPAMVLCLTRMGLIILETETESLKSIT